MDVGHRSFSDRPADLTVTQFRALFEAVPGAHLVLLADDPVFTVMAVSDDYLRASGLTQANVIGRSVFTLFPRDADRPNSDDGPSRFAAIRRVVTSRAPEPMGRLRFDVRNPVTGHVEERYWTGSNRPIVGGSGKVEFVLHTLTEVTKEVLRERSQHQRMEEAEILRSEAERAEKELAQANRRHSEVLESITDGFFVLDRDWRFVFVNAAAERILGASRDDLLGRNHWELYPATLGTLGEREYRRAAQERVPSEFEYFFEPWKRWFAIKAYPTQQHGLSVYFRDITERKHAEARLRESEERFSMAFEEAPIGMVLSTPDGTILEVNQAYLNMLGYTRDELNLRDTGAFTHVDDIVPTRQLLASLNDGSRSTATLEKRYLRRDGSLLWARASVTMRRDELGKSTQLIGIIEDITERKRAEELLRESQARLRAIYDGTHEYIGLLAPNGTLLEANRASLQFAGNAREDVVGLPFWDTPWFTYTPGAPELVREGVVRAAAGEFVWYEATLRRPSGEMSTFDISLHPIRNEHGEVVLIVPEGRDITERKAVELRDAFLVRLDDATRPLTQPSEITQTAARLLGEHLRVNRCAYADVEEDEHTFNLTGDYNHGVSSIVGRYSFAQFGAECLGLMREGKPFVVEDSESDPRTYEVRELYRQALIRSVICIPLLKTGRLAASMAVHQSTPRRWRLNEVELVQIVANRCWESIERARVARALETSERRLRLSQRAGRIGSFEWMMKEDKVIWTPELEALYGVPEGAFEGSLQDWGKRVVPEDVERVTAGIENCLARKQTEYDYEFRAILPDGKQRWLRGQAQFSYDEGGAPERMVGVNIDIDAQKQAETHLHKQWHTFDTALSHTPDLTYIFDLEGRFTYANQTMLDIWQRSLDEVVGKNLMDLNYPPELAERIQRQIQQVIDTKGSIRDQTPFTLPSGDYRHFEYILVPVIGADGRVDAVAGSTRDTTVRNKAEEALRKSEERLTFALAAGGGVGAWDWDIATDRVYSNARFAQLFSVDPERATAGVSFSDFMRGIHPDDRVRAVDNVQQALQTGEDYADEFRVVQGDGSLRWVYSRGRCHLDDVGNPVRFPGVVFDITERKTAEEELRRVNRELEEFAYVASHDLQEPLRMVNIYTHLILRRVNTEDATLSQYAQFVKEGVTRMEALIHDLLSFSRAVHAEDQPAGEADLSAALREAVSVLKGRIEESGALITSGPLPTATGDTAQIAHVFQNLLSNALKYRRKDVTPQIHVASIVEGDRCIISVRDNGIGFHPRYAERIFGLFKRLHKEEYPGTGLGLAICKRIVERYGGQLWGEGRPGEGATFYVSLPSAQGK